MRYTRFIALLIALALGLPAAAQTAATPQAANPPAATAAPAKALPATAAPAKAPAGTIIPGSPLAALTGAASAAPPNADADAPAPFGTNGIGFSIASAISAGEVKFFGNFFSAIRQSTRLAPVLSWLRSFSSDSIRRTHLANIAMALVITILPGLLVDAAIRFALARPRAALVNRAASRDVPPVLDDDEKQGLAAAEAGETDKPPRRRASLLVWGRRFFFGLLYFGLAIVPLIGFALTIQVAVWSGLLTTRPAHLAVIGIANAYLLCRVILAIVAVLVAPKAPSLRLIAMPTFRAVRIMRLILVLLVTGFFGYAFVSIAEILGLTASGATVLIRLMALVLHIEVGIAIWQSRRVVGRWIAGAPGASGFFAAFRHRLAGVWQYLALFYVLALWIAWAGGVHNAFVVLLRAVAVFLAALIIGNLAWTGSSTLLERAFPDPSTGSARHPLLFARAHAYNPLVHSVIRIVIGILVVAVILQGWGVHAFGWLLTNPFSRSLIGAFISIVITVAVALILWESANALINGHIERLSATGRSRQASRLRTLTPMLKTSIGVAIALVAGLISLSKIGVNAAPLLAGAGVLGIAIGFGSQKLVQDIITGMFLLLEDAMQVGDVITLGGMTGTVEHLSIRTIRLRGGDGSINIIPFSAVTTVTNMTRDFGYAQISITIGYNENVDHVSAVLMDIARAMRAEPVWGAMIRDDLQLFGLDQFGALGLVLTGQIRTGPGQHWSVRREFYGRVQKRFAEEGIEIPYSQQTFRLEPPPPPPDARQASK